MTDQARMDGKAVLRGKDAQCPVCHTDNLCFDGLRLGSTGVPCEGCGTLMDVVDQEYDTYFGALIPVYGVEICPKNDANFGQNEASHDH